jgi:glycerate dehydrogenase
VSGHRHASYFNCHTPGFPAEILAVNIVILDGFTLNPGDLSWASLGKIGPTKVYDRTPPGEVVGRARDAEIVLTNKTEINRAHLENLPKLKYIGVLATGTNIVDLQCARERGIPVTNVPGYGTRSVAQTAFALLLELTQNVGLHAQSVAAGDWVRCPDWCYWERPLIELHGLTMGIIGMGRIGQAVAGLASAFGMRVIANNPRPKPVSVPVDYVNLETLFRQSDVISLHCPLTPETKQVINPQTLSWMKPGAFLLNTSRGQLIDETSLADALNSGKIAGAGLDVLSKEPPTVDNPLLEARNCFITPHLAWASGTARARLLEIAVNNVRAFLAGKPENVVN